MGKIIALANQKGGVGKTTSAVNLSAALGIMGKKVLLIDADPQGNTTSGVGIDKKANNGSSYDILVNGADARECVIKTEFANLSVVPSHMNLAAAELEMADMQSREALLKRAILPLREEYDFIFIDCPPSLGLITVNAFTCADSVLVPIQCEYFALEGLSQLVATIRTIKKLYNQHLDIEGVLLTMYDGRLNLTMQVASEVKKHLGSKVYKTPIPRAVRISEAPSFGMPAVHYDKSSKGSIAYTEFAKEFLSKQK